MSGLLAGIRVVEVANWLAAPATGALLGDMGAEVIKVEPREGDAWRHFRLEAVGYPGPFSENLAFQLDNRGKRSITVNIDTEVGKQVVLRLVERSDVLLTNLLPRRVERYGLSYEEVSRANPRLIGLYLTGYGDRGPDRDRPGFDYTAFWVRSGMMSLLSHGEGPPIMQRPGMGDHTTCWLALSGVLAALYEREKSGRGQKVLVTLMGAGVWVIGCDMQAALVTHQNPVSRTRLDVPNPLWNTYRASDDRWFMLAMPQPDPYWPPLCEAIDRPELRDDPRFASFEARSRHNQELIRLLDGVFLTRERDEWARRFDEEGIIWAPARDLTDVIDDPQAREMGFYELLEHPNLGPIETIRAPLWFSQTPASVRGPAPELGQHTEEILIDLGYDWPDIARLREDGVI